MSAIPSPLTSAVTIDLVIKALLGNKSIKFIPDVPPTGLRFLDNEYVFKDFGIPSLQYLFLFLFLLLQDGGIAWRLPAKCGVYGNIDLGTATHPGFSDEIQSGTW